LALSVPLTEIVAMEVSMGRPDWDGDALIDYATRTYLWCAPAGEVEVNR